MKVVNASETTVRSRTAAFGAAAVVQGVIGVEFVLTGLSKFADPNYAANFRSFMQATPGARRGIAGFLVRTLVLPNSEIAAQLARLTELAIGLVLLAATVEVTRRALAGRLGARYGYEPLLALAAAGAGAGVAGLSLTIFLLQGGVLPGVDAGRAFASAITVELMMVPLGIGIAWLELGRFAALVKGRHVPHAVQRLVA